jgi:hypothetical protein
MEMAKQAAASQDPSATPAPADVRRRVERAARAIRAEEPIWHEALCFFDNDQFVERSAVNGSLQRVETREGTVGKPRWRSRMIRNRYTSAIEAEKAAAIARVPVPECSAPSGKPEAINASKYAERACLGAFQMLHLKTLALDTMTYTFNCGAGYAWPYWNSNVGEFLTDPVSGETLRTGEIDFWILAPDEVLWEPGVPFKKSRWYAVRKAQPVDEVMAREGYTGPKELAADAQPNLHEAGRSSVTDNLVFVYHYLERPSKEHKAGRWLQIAGGHEIAARQDYPCDKDVPVIHELADIRRPHRDRPMGRGQLMIDIQRTYNRTINQIIAWKNLVLNPQMMAPRGSLRGQNTEEPGRVLEYRPIGGLEPKWREIQEIPIGLFRTLDQCILDWREVTGQHDLPSSIESGSAVVAINERDMSRRRAFVEGLAEWYGDLFGHILYLMQRHYTEPRLLEFKSRFGRDSTRDFLGAKLMPGITVRVDPGTIEPRTRAAQEAKLVMYADKGWLPAHQVMAALNSGNADSIIDEFELDVAKANREIQQLLALGRGEGPGALFAAPMDNHQIHAEVLGAWMKTEDFEMQPELVKQAALAHYEQHQVEIQLAAFRAQLEQGVQAEALGRENATRPADSGGGQDVSRPSLESNVRGVAGAPAFS